MTSPPLTREERERLKRAIDRATRKRLAAGTRVPVSSARAVNFLLDALEDGPRPRAELVAEAEALGISQSALDSAKKHLGVEHAWAGAGRTVWLLPGWREGE